MPPRAAVGLLLAFRSPVLVTDIRAIEVNRYYLVVGVLFIAIGATMVAGKLLAFDAIVAFAVRTLSHDQVITAAGVALLARFWFAVAIASLLLGGLISACSIAVVRGALAQLIGRDALAEAHPEMPRPVPVLLWSSLIGFSVVILYLMHSRLGVEMPTLFRKEGLLENLTFALYLLSTVACTIAALRTHRNPVLDHHRFVAFFYLACALVFFVVAGEEVSWGQRVFDIKTPEALVALNYQQETNVHNLLSRSRLDAITKGIAVVFLLGLISMWAVVGVQRKLILHFVLPHPSLAGLALITCFSGLVLHLEIFEVLLAIFIAYYSYRVYKATVYLYSKDAALNLALSHERRKKTITDT